ncbi:MAG: class II aldolase/adducin family protein [Chloroflexi bacterium]|nr:class II aldolase/adducin family protein [Chloroflexota bacterium]
MHKVRWTLEKISARLQFLSEAAIYRRSQPLGPFKFHANSQPRVAIDVDGRDWEVIEPGSHWGELRQEFTWNGELYLELHRGTYTSQARNKRENRKCEFLLHDAEFLAAWASLHGDFAYPRTAENLVTVTLDGEIVDGDGRPSQELATHLLIYKLRSDIQGVFHSHSPWAIACWGLGDTIPIVTLHAQSKLGSIPILRLPGTTPQANLAAIESMLTADRNLQVFVQDRHGIFSFASSIELARHNAELVEETAQIAWSMALSDYLASERGPDA